MDTVVAIKIITQVTKESIVTNFWDLWNVNVSKCECKAIVQSVHSDIVWTLVCILQFESCLSWGADVRTNAMTCGTVCLSLETLELVHKWISDSQLNKLCCFLLGSKSSQQNLWWLFDAECIGAVVDCWQFIQVWCVVLLLRLLSSEMWSCVLAKIVSQGTTAYNCVTI